MIQRKQTLWFLLCAAVACLAFVLPFGFKNTTSMNSYEINVRDFLAQNDWILVALFSVLIADNLIAIFMFKKRNIQIMISVSTIILSIACLVYEIIYSTKDGNHIAFGLANNTLYIGLAIPVVCMLLSLMAMRGVQNDIKLLKDTDRLR